MSTISHLAALAVIAHRNTPDGGCTCDRCSPYCEVCAPIVAATQELSPLLWKLGPALLAVVEAAQAYQRCPSSPNADALRTALLTLESQ